ncbi:MAG TPA: SGNH/GDSL hydrolase family protein [Thermoanaerobaculia bacterium]|jgi:hypothetical protein|nr:SGNH/GDSL hydrolase family protein [Thermoanaerobaculia bacterium]
MTSKPARRLLMKALFIAAIAAAIELLSRGGLSVLERRGVHYQPILGDRVSTKHRQAIEDLLRGRPSCFQLDAVLGWSLRPGFRSPECTVDAEGRRRAPDRPQPATNAVRLAAFGDSFTFGGDVVDRDAYPEALARLDERLDIANYGVPAYGLDQAFLRYLKERRAARSQVVIIGYMSENICRHVSVFRPFYNPTTVFPLAKPRYLPGERGLSLFPNPLPTPEAYRRLLAHPAETLAELGRHDVYYHARPHAGPLDRSATVRLVKLAAAQLEPTTRDDCYADGEAFQVTSRLFSDFYETALRDGTQPVILIFPQRADLAGWRSDRRKSYTPLLRSLAGKGYRVVDAMAAFDEAGRERSIDELVPGHLSPLANMLVAEHLRRRLQSFGLIR